MFGVVLKKWIQFIFVIVLLGVLVVLFVRVIGKQKEGLSQTIVGDITQCLNSSSSNSSSYNSSSTVTHQPNAYVPDGQIVSCKTNDPHKTPLDQSENRKKYRKQVNDAWTYKFSSPNVLHFYDVKQWRKDFPDGTPITALKDCTGLILGATMATINGDA
jgi:cytoskeletal protein RodZ